MAVSSRVDNQIEKLVKTSIKYPDYHLTQERASGHLQAYLAAHPDITITHCETDVTDRKLIAHAVSLTAMANLPTKRPIIIIPSEKDSSAVLLEYMHALLNLLKSAEPHVQVIFYCQDYSGNGANHHDPKLNYSEFTLMQDVADQLKLFEYVLQQHTLREAAVITHSYGVSVGLLVMEKVIEINSAHDNIPFFADRAAGDPRKLLNRVYNALITDANINLLKQKGYLPDDLLHNVNMMLKLPRAMAINTYRNRMIPHEASLVHALQEKQQRHKTMLVESSVKGDDLQYVSATTLSMRHLKEITLAIVQVACVTNKRLVVTFDPVVLKNAPTEFKLHAEKSIAMPNYVETPAPLAYWVVPSSLVTEIIKELMAYAKYHADLACKHKLGAEYHTNYIGTKWTALQKVTLAMQLIEALFHLHQEKGYESLKVLMKSHEALLHFEEFTAINAKLMNVMDDLDVIANMKREVSVAVVGFFGQANAAVVIPENAQRLSGTHFK